MPTSSQICRFHKIQNSQFFFCAFLDFDRLPNFVSLNSSYCRILWMENLLVSVIWWISNINGHKRVNRAQEYQQFLNWAIIGGVGIECSNLLKYIGLNGKYRHVTSQDCKFVSLMQIFYLLVLGKILPLWESSFPKSFRLQERY